MGNIAINANKIAMLCNKFHSIKYLKEYDSIDLLIDTIFKFFFFLTN